MGATASVPFSDAASNAALQRLGGPNEIPPHDPAWVRVLSEAPLAKADASLLHQKLEATLTGLLQYNAATSNVQVLLTVTISLLNDARAKLLSTSPTVAAPTLLSAANALHLLGLVIRAAAQQGYDATQTAALFEVPESLPVPSVLVQQGQSQLMKVLVRRVVALVIQTPVSDLSYLLLHDAMLLLLQLASPALHRPSARSPTGAQPLLDCMHAQRQLAGPLIQKLLQVYLHQPLPSSSERPWRDPALLQAAAAQASSSYLWVPFSTPASASLQSASRQLPPHAGPSPLGDLALQLLLLLIYAPDDPPATCNPYRRALAALQDEEVAEPVRGSEDGMHTLSPKGSLSLSPQPSATLPAHIVNNGHAHNVFGGAEQGLGPSFRQLHDALATWGLSSDPELAVLLLYSLLHGCPAFRNHTLGRTNVETLLVPLLRQLYTCPPSACSHAYLLQVLLLLLSQDTPLMQAIQHTHIPPSQLVWYKDHVFSAAAGSQVSLGSVMVMVLVKALLAGFGAGASQASRGSGPDAASSSVAHHGAAALTAEGTGSEVTTAAAAAALPQLSSDPLPTNALAALANLAPSIVGLHHHAAQRLVGLFKALSKRHARLLQLVPPRPQGPPRHLSRQASGQHAATISTAQQNLSPNGTQPLSPVDAGRQQLGPAQLQRQTSGLALQRQPSSPRAPLLGPPPPEIATQLSVIEDFLQVLLEVLVVPLECAGGAQRNPELVYALLQHQECFAPFARHPRLADHIRSLQDLMCFFNKHLEEAQAAASGSGAEWGVAKVMEVIAAAALFWRPGPAAAVVHHQAIRFVYEEEGHPEDFFVPYLWALLVPRLPVSWDTSTFRLFSL